MSSKSELISDIAKKIHNIFSSDQPFYAIQKDDGNYQKKYGFLSESLIEKSLTNKGSIAVYQKQQDFTIKWLCFDFDILKANLESNLRSAAENTLNKTVQNFTDYLTSVDIPHLVEFSGNRGYHVWIFFQEKTYYSTGYRILETIIEKSELSYDNTLIGLDKFPKTSTPSSGVGLGVKIPLSYHKKSLSYSYLISDLYNVNNKISNLTDDLLKSNMKLLNSVKSVSIVDFEKKLETFFPRYENNEENTLRIKSISLSKKDITLRDIINHWDKSTVLSQLSKKIKNNKNLNNNERKLIVGLLHSIESPHINKIIHDIFRTMDNYKSHLTEQALKNLCGYYFPNKKLIEITLNEKFNKGITTNELLLECIPFYSNYKNAYFDFSEKDIDIVRKSETNYLYMNDEVNSRLVSDDLLYKSNESFLTFTHDLLKNKNNIEFYEHIRLEENKERILITLDSNTRVATSLLIKQISYFLNIDFGNFSHGYQINKGFANCHIFKPWLNQWHKFISNISNAIDEPLFQNYYIIKTDISSFYDSISHDRLQRILLGDGNKEISNQITTLNDNELCQYNEFISCLLTVTKKIRKNNNGLPQGPAYARYLAELYLLEIDSSFNKLFLSGDIFLYQRYVDDIFIICGSKQDADLYLNNLKSLTLTLGLQLNQKKTIIKEIVNSKNDFNNYKSQSKYNVDNINKQLDIANENQKEIALEEFIKLIESDSAQHDLSFIFSHLEQMHELDNIKLNMIPDTLESGIGRGSMYRNMFNFILQSDERIEQLLSTHKFNTLQSEVITSTILNAYDSDIHGWEKLNNVLYLIEKKLILSDLVNENISYMVLYYGYDTNLEIDNKYYIKVLSKVNEKNILANEDIFFNIQFELNAINDMNVLINVLHAIAFSNNTNKKIISFSKEILLAKLSIEKISNRLDIDNHKNLIADENILTKLYTFLCLFSISKIEDLTPNENILEYWKFCISSFDNLEIISKNNYSKWVMYINFIDIDYNRLNLIISYISEGSIVRGVQDKCNLFLSYHSVLLINFILEEESNNFSNLIIDENTRKILLETSVFYSWLLDKSGTTIFPNNKEWFENNAIKNGVIILRNKNEILIRKHESKFSTKNTLPIDKYGYSDLIINYDEKELININRLLQDLPLQKRLKLAFNFIENHDDDTFISSIFTHENVIKKSDYSIFNNEFYYSNSIIYEKTDSSILLNDLNNLNYIDYYFKLLSEFNKFDNKLFNKYYLNLNKNINQINFFTLLSESYISDDIENSDVGADLLISTAVYNDLSRFELNDRLNKFVSQYFKFHNNEYMNMSVFAVEKNMDITGDNINSFLNLIIESTRLINEKVYIGLNINIDKDMKTLKENIEKLISESHAGENNFNLYDFKKSKHHQIKRIENKLTIDENVFEFEDVEIINLDKMELNKLETSNTLKIQGSDRIYYFHSADGCIIFPVSSELMKMWKAIEQRYNTLIIEQSRDVGFEVIGNINQIESLNGFNKALYIIEEHNQISNDDARYRLRTWLYSIPESYRELILKLIAAHECMTKDHLSNFINYVKQLSNNSTTSFMIKNPDDYNGTHRIFYKDIDSQLGRNLSKFNLLNLANEDKIINEITFIMDNIISGSQFISAMKYYTGIKPEYTKNSNFYLLDSKNKEKINSILLSLKTINICTILYNTKAKINIETKLKEFMPNLEKINIKHGTNINGNAFFGTTTKLSKQEKDDIADFLLDDEKRKALHESVGIKFNKDTKKFNNIDELNKMNLVSRYCSMPKSCFMFLIAPSIFDREIKIFNRFEELNAKDYLKE